MQAANLGLIPINARHVMTTFERAMAAKMKTKHYYSAHNIATRVSFGTQTSVHDSDHYDEGRIFVGLS